MMTLVSTGFTDILVWTMTSATLTPSGCLASTVIAGGSIIHAHTASAKTWDVKYRERLLNNIIQGVSLIQGRLLNNTGSFPKQGE